MNTTLLLFAIGAGIMTLLGGFFSIRFKDKAHLITSFSAGVIIGLAFFDLLPESVELSGLEIDTVVIFIAFGFVFYLILDRIFHNHKQIQNHNHDDEEHIEHGHRGTLRAGSLAVHSFFDGLGIGFAFKISWEIGLLVSIAVLAHKFSDGINTVSAILSSSKKISEAKKWLYINATAPILGIFTTFFIIVSESALGIILAVFTGFFIYLGASDLIPESYHNHPNKLTTLMTILGMIFIFTIISFAHAH